MKPNEFDFSAVVTGSLRVEYLTGHMALKTQEIAALTGVHAVVLEMARTLLDEFAKDGAPKVARFKLATEEMKKHSDDIASEFFKGLRKATKALSKDPIGVKGGRDADCLAFWLVKKKPWPSKKKAAKVNL